MAGIVKKDFALPKKKKLASSVSHEIQKSAVSAPVHNWDDLTGLYQSIANAIISVAIEVKSIIERKEIAEHIENRVEFDTFVNALFSDSQRCSGIVRDIYEKHKDFSGLVKTDEELRLILTLYEEYIVLNSDFQTNITNSMLEISIMAMDASERYEATLKQPTQPEAAL